MEMERRVEREREAGVGSGRGRQPRGYEDDEEEEPVGCFCKVFKGWAKSAIRRRRGE